MTHWMLHSISSAASAGIGSSCLLPSPLFLSSFAYHHLTATLNLSFLPLFSSPPYPRPLHHHRETRKAAETEAESGVLVGVLRPDWLLARHRLLLWFPSRTMYLSRVFVRVCVFVCEKMCACVCGCVGSNVCVNACVNQWFRETRLPHLSSLN